VQMPGIDGFETATLIRQRERSRDTPIIFLTAFSTSDTKVYKGYELGAVDYLLKPIDPTILLSKVIVFVDLFKKTMEVKRQATQLASVNVELRQSEERFRSLCVCSPIGIFLTDPTGHCTYSNPSCQAICGFKLEENREAGWGKFIHLEDCDRILSAWSNSTHQGQAYTGEFRIYTSDRSVRWVNVRISPMLSEEQQLLGHVGTIEDITERKQAEAAREQLIREQIARQQAEEANRMKDEFLAIVSHELRTPLNAILGWSRLLITKKFDPAGVTRALQTIERSARSQAQLIEDILDISQLIRGKVRLSIQSVNLIVLIETVLDTLRPLADAKAIHIETQLDPTAKMVNGDPDRLRQIIGNLLSNAIKFTPESGRVDVRLTQWQIADYNLQMANKNFIPNSQSKIQNLKSKISYAQLQVIDTGVGINSEFLPYVFDRFRQADTTTTRKFGGLGLGLAIVRHLVKLHGGEIYAESEGEGKGATFTVNLPLKVSSFGLNAQNGTDLDGFESGYSTCLAGVKVLVVEDNTDTRDFIALVLEQCGAEVTAVGSTKEAMECLKQCSPHVLVSDIGMPGEDGYSLIRQVRAFEQQQGGKIPAVALTAYTRPEDRMEALSAGFQIHIPKPIEPPELVKVVSQLVERQVSAEC
jgi:PAS domain S-box-containing protein